MLRIFLACAAALPLLAQSQPTPGPQPIYRVNIVERTTPALNYGHLTQPTKIDFAGTALLPEAHGDATVETNRGAVLVHAHFDKVPPPTRFGPSYLTYVVWAISPEGRAQNLGELVLNGSDKGNLTASTAMQAFALIVTAEPYFAVSQPSDVVVMENRVRPDTVGKVEQVNATYELLPRKQYTYNIDRQTARGAAGGRPCHSLNMRPLPRRYQAWNAIQIALAAGAQKYAPERLDRAQQLLISADRLSAKEFSHDVVATAREAAQIAEDARVIAVRRSQEEREAREQARQQQLQQEAQQSRAAAEIASERERLATERARLEQQQAQLDRERAEIFAAAQQQAAAQANAREQSAAVQSQTADRMRTAPDDSASRANRRQLTEYLRGYFNALDTPRGIVVTIPDTTLEAPGGAERVRMRLASRQAALTRYQGLHFEVDGYSDTAAGSARSQLLAEQVRDMLIAEGLPPQSVMANGYGATRPVASNATAAGREQNRRVEIVITGQPIGDTPAWDHAYSLNQ